MEVLEENCRGNSRVLAQQPTDRFRQARSWNRRWDRVFDDRPALRLSALIQAMDQADIDIALLSAWHGPAGSLISNDEVSDFIDEVVACTRADASGNGAQGATRAPKLAAGNKSPSGTVLRIDTTGATKCAGQRAS